MRTTLRAIIGGTTRRGTGGLRFMASGSSSRRETVQAFVAFLNALEPDGDATSCGDSLLASVMTATDPAAVLDALWPALREGEDLFQRVLRVNHLAGTVPHPQMHKDNLRQPISWHYPLIVQWLHAKQMDVIRVAPAEVALIAETWLRTAGQNSNLPARNEAAALALALATAARADWCADKHRSPFRAKRPAYQCFLRLFRSNPTALWISSAAVRKEFPMIHPFERIVVQRRSPTYLDAAMKVLFHPRQMHHSGRWIMRFARLVTIGLRWNH